MDELSNRLNELLVSTFRSILKVEEHSLLKMGVTDITINELHLIEAIASFKGGCTISEIAQAMSITLSSVTIAINKLNKKNYVQKTKGESDGRVVMVTLTQSGRKMNTAHKYFHKKMISAISAGISEEEKRVLIQGIDKLDQFFNKQLSDMEV